LQPVEIRRYVFRGTVQGVGFRPAVYRAAVSLGLHGFVQNRRSEVFAEIKGAPELLDRFLRVLKESLPPAARIEAVDVRVLHTAGVDGDRLESFRIAESASSDYRFPPIPPDLAICPECARELLDPSDRRYLYPFITCTQCGPRYSIVEKTPFDRGNTSMRTFSQCPACEAEYGDPKNRRFHSQTNSCSTCGPRLGAVDARGGKIQGDPLKAVITALNSGKIVGIQGIGGFHLAADPGSSQTMSRLRSVKDRESKPFALMTRDMTAADKLCILSPEEKALLASPESPIIILRRRRGVPGHLESVSDTGTLGIMMPYTPIHLLLFRHPDFPLRRDHLVMTSGNRAGEPIVTDIEGALERLSDIADMFIYHDRKILFRTDDSLVRMGSTPPFFLMRRSRGYVPRLIGLPREVAGTILGTGGDLKSAPALARGRDVHLSPFLGDLDEPECLAEFEAHIRGLIELYGAVPDLVVHDLHPRYQSTRWADRSSFPKRAAVQHHHAHALSVMAEHGLDEALALCFDGTGYGTDATIWGGEFLQAGRRSFKRLGSFRAFPLPGGDAAVLHPPRIAFSILADPSLASSVKGFTGGLPGLSSMEESMIRAMIEKGVNVPASTSLGRIFDAAASVLGLVTRTGYEGEGPIRLEGAALTRPSGGKPLIDAHEAEALLPFTENTTDAFFTIDPAPLLLHLLRKRELSSVGELAFAFHEAVVQASAEGARRMRKRTGMDVIVLSGGVFQNLLLRDLLIPLLKHDGFRVFLNEAVPPGDGGISLGQVYYVPQ
jgi:hydrogenase maturation protein HypF